MQKRIKNKTRIGMNPKELKRNRKEPEAIANEQERTQNNKKYNRKKQK